MKKKYKVEDIGTHAFAKRLTDAALPYQGNQGPMANILRMVQDPPLNCSSVVFEYEYVDADYQDEFAAFYAKTFKNYSQRCTRLHFFSVRLPKRDFANLGKFRDNYIGFMVVRPTDLQRVGRTIIKPPIQDPNKQFVTCHSVFTANILGDEFNVDGMPFFQQDTQVGACAQACLWMLARHMSRRFGYRQFFPAEINQMAKVKMALGRHLPAEDGLTLEQMLEALQGMGFAAVAYQRSFIGEFSEHIDKAFSVRAHGKQREKDLERRRTAKLADIAYRYIESGLPVIFGTRNHALIGIGHTYRHNHKATVALQRIPEFFVNNDREGCYRLMPIFKPSIECSFGEVEMLIAVTPSEATLRGEIAEAAAMAAISDLLDLKIDATDKYSPKYRKALTDMRPEFGPLFRRLEYRTYLEHSTRFQKDLRLAMDRGQLDRKLGRKLLELDYPKYIWISEVSSPALLNHADKKDRKCLGRVVVDSTAPKSTDGAIAIHFADLLFLKNRQTGKTERNIFPGSTPFPHKLW